MVNGSKCPSKVFSHEKFVLIREKMKTVDTHTGKYFRFAFFSNLKGFMPPSMVPYLFIISKR